MLARGFGLHPAKLPKQLPHDVGKLTVLLDIDETLIHSVFLTNQQLLKEKKQKRKYSQDHFQIENEGSLIRVHRRPDVSWFLEQAAKKFELVTLILFSLYYSLSK